MEAGGDGGSGGVGADAAACAAAVSADEAVAAASALLLEAQSAAYVWIGLLQARPVSSIQPSVERRAEKRQLVRWAGQTWRPVGPVGPDSA